MIFMPVEVFRRAMALSANDDSFDVFSHVANGLRRLELFLYTAYLHGNEVSRHFHGVTGDGIVLQPSPYGIELFLWAQGRRDIRIHEFLRQVFQPEMIADVTIPPGVCKTSAIGPILM